MTTSDKPIRIFDLVMKYVKATAIQLGISNKKDILTMLVKTRAESMDAYLRFKFSHD